MPNKRVIYDPTLYVEEEQRFQAEGGHVLDTQDIDLLAVPSQKAYDVNRLSDYGEITFFTLGPLYMALGIGFDIIETFRADTQVGTFERHTLYFEHPIIEGLREWGLVLEGLPHAVAMMLFQYLDTQTMIRRDMELYAMFLRREIRMADPYAIDRRDMVPGEEPVRVVAYVPSTNKYRWEIADVPPGPPPVTLRLMCYQPLADVVRVGDGVLKAGL